MRTTLPRAALAACALVLASAAFAATDNVDSGNIKEADGTTGQDTNVGSGVKTGHLQDGAVTAPKLAQSAVGTAAISDGAVTPEKLFGRLPAAKIDRAGLDADSVDGYHSGDFSPIGHDHVTAEIQGLDAYQKKHRNVVVVAKDGTGAFTEPGPAAASITDASASNPYVIKVMPGRYELVEPVLLKPFVDLEGSGRGVTILRGASPAVVAERTVVMLRGDSEVRDLTVESDGVEYATGGWGRFTNIDVVAGGNSPNGVIGIGMDGGEIRSVRITVKGGEGLSAQGINAYAPHLPVTLSNVEVTVEGGPAGWMPNYGYRTAFGLAVAYGTVVDVLDSRFKVTGLSRAQGIGPGSVNLRDVVVIAATSEDPTQAVAVAASGQSAISNSVLNAGPNGTALQMPSHPTTLSVANTQLVGRFAGSWPDSRYLCFGDYDAALAPVTCPTGP